MAARVDHAGPYALRGTHRRGVTPPLIVLGGATATGKTGLAIELAEVAHRRWPVTPRSSPPTRARSTAGLDIGDGQGDARRTAPGSSTTASTSSIPTRSFTVAAFNVHVAGVLAALATRDGVAILAGGTGFYLRSVMQGLDTARLPADPAIRAQVRADLEADGLERTYERLVALAPALAASIERSNPRRVERALEIALIQGDAALPPRTGYPGPLLALGLAVEPDAHAARIADRARAPVRRRAHRGGAGAPRSMGSGAAGVLGDRLPRGLVGHRRRRRPSRKRSTADVERTIAFAKRQRTWFRAERVLRVARCDATRTRSRRRWPRRGRS